MAILINTKQDLSNDDCLEGNRGYYQVCSVQYCVQQLCTVQCTHIWTDLAVVCWLDLTFLWLYCVLQFICVRFSFLWLFLLQFVHVCFCCVSFSVFSTMPSDRLGIPSPVWPITVSRGTWNLNSVNQSINMATLWFIRYGDGAGNTVEENSSIFSLIRMR